MCCIGLGWDYECNTILFFLFFFFLANCPNSQDKINVVKKCRHVVIVRNVMSQYDTIHYMVQQCFFFTGSTDSKFRPSRYNPCMCPHLNFWKHWTCLKKNNVFHVPLVFNISFQHYECCHQVITILNKNIDLKFSVHLIVTLM